VSEVVMKLNACDLLPILPSDYELCTDRLSLSQGR